MARSGLVPIFQLCHLRFCTRMFATAYRAQPISASEFAARRSRLLSSLDLNTLLIILASDEVTYSQDILYPHRQNSLFYHLFGLQEPLRRSLSPPTSAFTNDVRLTCATFVKTRSGARTYLFVPPQTTDPAVLTWASQPKTLGNFTRMYLSPCERKKQSHATTEAVKATAGCSLWSESAHLNDVKTIASVLYEEIQASAQDKWVSLVEKHGLLLRGDEPMEENKVRLLYKELDPLPQLLIDFPTQLRWTKQQYRLEASPQGPDAVAEDSSTRSSSPTPVSVTFRHPFEALLCVLLAFRFRFAWPSSCLAPAPRVGLPAVKCVYHLPPPLRAWGWGGGLPSTNAQREQLWDALRLSNNATPRGAVAVGWGVIKRSPLRAAEDVLLRYRLLKSPRQVAQHWVSAAATRQAFHAAMRCAARGVEEHAVAVAFDRAVLDLSEALGPGRVRGAYLPVVASGVRATEIHYTHNDAKATAGELLRLDAGVEVDLVPTDCTRTFPVGRRVFSEDQKKIYGAVLQTQQGLLQGIQSGLSISEVSRRCIELTMQALKERLGVRGVTQSQVRSLFCAHDFGHLMGLDIHEEFPQSKGMQRGGLTFLGGMVHTVEPGVYLPDADRAAAFNYDISCIPHALRGVGVQIEDDILILPRQSDNSEEQSPWSRLDYLNEVLRTIEVLLQDEDYVKGCVFLRDERLQRYKAQLTPSQFSALYLLLLQRTSLFGLPEAIESLSLDVVRVQTHFTERRPVSEWVPSSCEWYPFEVVVLTACIPKEISHIEVCMS